MVCTAQYLVCTVQNLVCTVQYLVCTEQYMMYCTVHGVLYCTWCTVQYMVYCTVRGVMYMMYCTTHCVMCTTWCTVQYVQWRLMTIFRVGIFGEPKFWGGKALDFELFQVQVIYGLRERR